MKRLCVLMLLSSMGSIACGSDDSDGDDGGAGGGGGDPKCAAQMGPLDPSALIDDFEDGNAALPRTAGRQSDWWLSTDETPAGVVTPAPGALPPERIIGGRCDSLYGLRVSGQGFTQWGVVATVVLRYEEGVGEVPMDLSNYRGLRFWARAGELNTATVRVGVHDVTSHPKGGVCKPDSTATGEQCYDSFGSDLIQLGTGWTEYAIHFDRLQQRNFGVPADALDTKQVYQLDFAAAQDTIFDFWIDDLWLFE